MELVSVDLNTGGRKETKSCGAVSKGKGGRGGVLYLQNKKGFPIVHAGDIPFIKGIPHPYLHSIPLLLLFLVLHVPRYECAEPELEHFVLKNRRDIQCIFSYTYKYFNIRMNIYMT